MTGPRFKPRISLRPPVVTVERRGQQKVLLGRMAGEEQAREVIDAMRLAVSLNPIT